MADFSRTPVFSPRLPQRLALLAILAGVAATGCKMRKDGARLRDAEAAAPDAGAAPPSKFLDGYVPMFAVSRTIPPGMKPEFEDRLIAGLTTAFQKVAADAAVNAAIESRSANTTARAKFDFFRFMAEIDGQLATQVRDGALADDLKALADGQSGEYKFEAMLLRSESTAKLAELRAAAARERDALIPRDFQDQLIEKLQWAAASADSTGQLSDKTDDAINEADAMIVVSADVAAQTGAYNEAYEAFMKFRGGEESRDKVLPIYLMMRVTFDKDGVGLEVQTQIKPNPQGGSIPPPNPASPVVPYMMSYATNKVLGSRDPPPVQHVTLKRKYGVESAKNESPKLVIEYGRLKPQDESIVISPARPNDIRDLWVCQRECKDEIESVPTVMIRIDFPFLKKSGTGNGNRVLDWAATSVLALGRIAAPQITMYALVKKITADLADPRGIRVVPDETEVHLVIRSLGATSAQTFIKQISPSDPKALGWNIYNMPLPVPGGSLGGTIADNATPQVRDPLSKVNEDANKAFGKMFGSLMTSFSPVKAAAP